jgi:hypothetical protein
MFGKWGYGHLSPYRQRPAKPDGVRGGEAALRFQSVDRGAGRPTGALLNCDPGRASRSRPFGSPPSCPAPPASRLAPLRRDPAVHDPGVALPRRPAAGHPAGRDCGERSRISIRKKLGTSLRSGIADRGWPHAHARAYCAVISLRNSWDACQSEPFTSDLIKGTEPRSIRLLRHGVLVQLGLRMDAGSPAREAGVLRSKQLPQRCTAVWMISIVGLLCRPRGCVGSKRASR